MTLHASKLFPDALTLTRELVDALDEFRAVAGTPESDAAQRHLEHVRHQRLLVYGEYERCFGEDAFDELIEACDQYFNQLCGI